MIDTIYPFINIHRKRGGEQYEKGYVQKGFGQRGRFLEPVKKGGRGESREGMP